MIFQKSIAIVVTFVLALPFQAFGQSRAYSIAIADVDLPQNVFLQRERIQSATYQAFKNLPRAFPVPLRAVERFRDRQLDKKSKYAGEIKLAREALLKGKDLYQALKIQEAVVELEKARRLFVLNLPGLRSNRELIDAHLFLGVAYAVQNKTKKAEAEFKRVVLLDSKRTLSVRDYPPNITELFATVREKLITEEPIRVQIVSEPEGARVFINAKEAGETPMTARLRSGEYFVLVEKPGSLPWFRPIELEQGLEIIRAELSPDVKDRQYASLFRTREGREQDSPEVQFLDRIGRSLKADFVFLGKIQKQEGYRILGQLYEVESERFSKVARLNLGSDPSNYPQNAIDLAETLDRFVDAEGKLITSKPKADLRVPNADANPLLVSDPSQRKRQALQAAPAPPKPWYLRWWIWPIVAGVGFGVYLGATQLGGSSGSNIVIDNSGNF